MNTIHFISALWFYLYSVCLFIYLLLLLLFLLSFHFTYMCINQKRMRCLCVHAILICVYGTSISILLTVSLLLLCVRIRRLCDCMSQPDNGKCVGRYCKYYWSASVSNFSVNKKNDVFCLLSLVSCIFRGLKHSHISILLLRIVFNFDLCTQQIFFPFAVRSLSINPIVIVNSNKST